MSKEPHDKKNDVNPVGAGIAIGAGLGVVLLALTDSPVWIGVGAALGAALGAGWQGRQSS